MELIDKSVELIIAGDRGRQCKQGEADPSTVFVMFVRAHRVTGTCICVVFCILSRLGMLIIIKTDVRV